MPTLSENRTALFEYEILETYEAGLALTGAEVKAVKNGSINLKGSFITFFQGKPRLTNAHISHYTQARPDPTYDPTRSRSLLLHKKQIRTLAAQSQEKGLTIVPLRVYTKGHLIKVAVALVRGRHQYDKRDVLKRRDADREARQTLKNQLR